jgi:hypothetical protein
MKTKIIGGASVRELKAAALDSLVKAELAKTRAADASKISRLKALRLAKDAEQIDSPTPAEKTNIRTWPRKSPPVRRSAS